MDNLIQVSIIIVSYNRLNVLKECLTSIEGVVDAPAFEIILVDNASPEKIAETIRSEFPNVRVITTDHNVGFGKGNNIGAKAAKGAYLLFMNSDVILRNNPVPQMVESLQQNIQIGVVGNRLRNQDESIQPSFFRFPSLWMRFLQLSGAKQLIVNLLPSSNPGRLSVSEPGFVSGAFFMMRKKLFDEIGGFDERYFMYLEDADLGYQIHRRKLKAALIPTDDVVHLGRHYEVESLPFVFHHMNRGQILFYQKNYSPWKLIILCLMSIGIFALRYGVSVFGKNSNATRTLYADTIRVYSKALVESFQ